jgi:hypothetical protein
MPAPEKRTFRKSKAISLGEGIKELLKFYHLEGRFNETYVVANWEKLMGKTIASRTEKIYFKEKKLFVKLSSSPLKRDLFLSKNKIIDLLNDSFQENVVEDVIFL